MATWVPCVPVSVKNVEPSVLFEIVMCFTSTKWVNSYTWQAEEDRSRRTIVAEQHGAACSS